MRVTFYILLLSISSFAFGQTDSIKNLLKGEWHLTHYKNDPLLLDIDVPFFKIQQDSAISVTMSITDDEIVIVESFGVNYRGSRIIKDTGRYYYRIVVKPQNLYRKFELLLFTDNKNARRIKKTSDHNRNFNLVKLDNSTLHLESKLYNPRMPMVHSSTFSFYFEKQDSVKTCEKDFLGAWFLQNAKGMDRELDTLVLVRDNVVFIEDPSEKNDSKINCKTTSKFGFNSDFSENSWEYNSETSCSDLTMVYRQDLTRNWSLNTQTKILVLNYATGDVLRYRYEFGEERLLLIKLKN